MGRITSRRNSNHNSGSRAPALNPTLRSLVNITQAIKPFAAKTHTARKILFIVSVESSEELTSISDKGLFLATQCLVNDLPSTTKCLCCPGQLYGILWPMSTAWFHTVASILLTACVFFFALGNYYGYVMTLEVRSRLPDSRWSWLRAWWTSPLSHRKYCPDSQMPKKWLVCQVGMFVCGFLGFFFWMKYSSH
jgi:hypothetical protein